jgi:hypothetical protein
VLVFRNYVILAQIPQHISRYNALHYFAGYASERDRPVVLLVPGQLADKPTRGHTKLPTSGQANLVMETRDGLRELFEDLLLG